MGKWNVHKTREIPSSTTATLKRLKEFTLSKINDLLPAQLVMSVKWEQGLYHLCYYYFGLQLRTKVPVTFHPITVAIQAVLQAILCNSGVLCMRKDRSLPSQKCVGIFRFSCLFCIPSHRAIVVGTTNWLLTYDLQLRDLLLLGLIRSMESNWRQRRVAAVFAFHSHIYKDIACTTLHSIPFQHSQFGSCG